MNLKDEEEKYNAKLEQTQESIYRRIAEQYGSEINPMRYLTKGKSSIHTTIRTYESIHNNIEQLKDNKETPFKTMSEAYRAVIYFGTLVFFHIYNDKNANPDTTRLTDFIEDSESITFTAHLTDDIIEQIQKIYGFIDRKIMPKKTGIKQVRKLMKLIPSDLRPYCEQYAENVFNGAKPIHVFDKARKGRPQNEG